MSQPQHADGPIRHVGRYALILLVVALVLAVGAWRAVSTSRSELGKEPPSRPSRSS